uniref:Phosphoribulokinase (Fragments) n=1 Tax=Pinus pinaster TaxID=71647 RepID=KPPR_PINPS|nr:RecName: Full=Phosphoribulokinase; Short=PRK; Short=PRKase; AltName: Full=Phosphopentokinase [Pinus pinaster]
ANNFDLMYEQVKFYGEVTQQMLKVSVLEMDGQFDR